MVALRIFEINLNDNQSSAFEHIYLHKVFSSPLALPTIYIQFYHFIY